MKPIRFIAGSGRSGTTWILDVLADANGLRPVFEPLHPYVSDVGQRYAHRALPADEEHPIVKDFLIATCAGRGPRLWTQYRQQKRWLFPPPGDFNTRGDAGRTKRHWAKFMRELPKMFVSGLRPEPIVKCIRANLMLPWIARHLGCRIVLVVRHPAAVVESELRGRWNANFVLERFRHDERLQKLTHDRYRPLLSRQLNPVEALAARWVIENQWVMEAAAHSGISVFHYEHLRSTSTNEWRRLCSTLTVTEVPDVERLTRPSQQSGTRRKTIPLPQSSSPRWMSSLTTDQRTQIRGILDSVGFDAYSMNEPNPLPTATAGLASVSAGTLV
jgi:hypothetical protein